MRAPPAALCACILLAAASCAGASSRYGCPVAEGLSCRSVSRVHSDVVSGRDGREVPEARERRERKRGAKGRPRPRRGARAEEAREEGARAGLPAAAPAEEPVYLAPRAVRIWIAPWLERDGVFHSAKYVWVLPERGTWTVGGVAVPAEDPPGRGRETFRLRGTEGGR